MLTDGLTKQLNKEQFKNHKKRMGIKNITD